MQLPPESYSNRFSDFLRSYYLAPEHPCKLRLLSWIEGFAGNKRIAVKTNAGFRVAVDRRDYIQRTIYKNSKWEPEIENSLQFEARPEDVFYDIGANIGYFSLFSLHAGCSCVVAFEPSLELSAIYQHNMEINQIANSKWCLFNYALSDTSGISYYAPGPIENSGVGHLTSNSNETGIEIEVVTLDGVIEAKRLPIPTIIKLDVEGWELQILKGAIRTFANNPPRVVFFEADVNSIGEMLDTTLAAFFIKRGYSIKHLKREVCEAKENFIAIL